MNSPASSLPEFIVENPRLGDWFALALPGKLTLKTGKVEIGQNILTALRQIAAEELELPFSVVDVLSGDTSVSPDEGPTVASLSIMMSGPAVRVAAAEMRGRLFQAAAARLGVPASQFSAVDGVFHIAGTVTEAEVTYWTVMATSISTKELQEVFPVRIQKPIGLSARALFLLISSKKLSGPAFIHDFSPDGMLHGRALRQPHFDAKLVRFDAERARGLPGVISIVHDGNFLGVVAESEHLLFAAMDRLERLVEWDLGERDEGASSPLDYLDKADSTAVTVHADFEDRQRNWRYAATFTKPLIGHGSIGPSCAVAWFEDGGLRIWTHSQNVFALRKQAARVLEFLKPTSS